jgi:hypothetical protein|nr:MAG TPA: hypothetical protein [Caudoviricetes sp.]
MSEYKRLTEKVFTHDDGSSEYDCDASVRATNNRLGQLEDKIEEGKLVELPCKVGDTVYQTDGIRVYESVVKNIIFDTSGVAFDKSAIGKDIFLTREAAEARLKELEAIEK